jgi:intracellular septation protein A
VVVPAEEFHLNPPKTRDLLVGSGPRFARDAFGPIVAFYVGWKLVNLGVGIGLSTAVALLAYRHERRNERPGVMARVALAIVLVQAVVGLLAGSERVYLAQPVLVTAIYGTAFLVSTFIGRPLAATFAREMYPFPDEVRESSTFHSAFNRISVAWGCYLLLRSAVRLAMLASSSVEAYLLINVATGIPLMMLMMSWSTWYGIRFFRRSEEWGPAIRALEEAQAAVVPPTVPPPNPAT